MISYCITVYNELEEIKRLLNILNSIKSDDEIVIVQTYKEEIELSEQVFSDIQAFCKNNCDKYSTFHFQNNFAELKNYMTSQASHNYIFNFDADEYMDPNSMLSIREIVTSPDNQSVELYYLPRINIVDNITPEDISKWGWNLNENNWINWPDYQSRIYKNNNIIKWEGLVHERLVNFINHAVFDKDERVAIIHHKTIEKQRKQNELYNNII